LLGSKIRIVVRGEGEREIDRIRLREHEAKLEALLSPLEESSPTSP
jgi:hypothetical protein